MASTKIVATLGPASGSPQIISQLLRAGVGVVRVNCSHGEVGDHLELIARVRSVAAELGCSVAVLADLQGPKIRVGDLAAPVDLLTGSQVVLRGNARSCGDGAIPVVYPAFATDLRVGDVVLLHDGLLETIVTEVEGDDVTVQVVRGGLLRSRKGVNMPSAAVSATTPTEQDLEHLTHLAGVVDFVAMSFVRSAAEVLRLREALRELASNAQVVAKLERREAIEDLEEILDVVDVVMVARGDLGVEVGPQRVPVIQKRVIARANTRGIPVITATEMLESMITSSRPTRAEASDVANAVFDGTDAVMLSAETASGENPVEAVTYMRRICESAEEASEFVRPVRRVADGTDAHAVSRAVRQMAEDTSAVAVVCFTQTGASARAVAASRPGVRILALTPSESTERRCGIYHGVESATIPHVGGTDEQLELANAVVRERGLADRGDAVIVVTGTPGKTGRTNRVYVHRVE